MRDQAAPNGPLEERTVLGTTAHVVYGTEKVELAAADGQTQTLESTPEHPYWVEGQGWTNASELRPGEQVRTPEGGDLTVIAIQFQYQPTGVIVYNLIVDGDHTYFVQQAGSNDPVWVHNAGECPVHPDAPWLDPSTKKLNSQGGPPVPEEVPPDMTPEQADKALEDVQMSLMNRRSYQGNIDAGHQKRIEIEENWEAALLRFLGI